MLIPAAMFIESAVDMLKDVSQEHLDDQTKELESALGAHLSEYTPQAAYNLGLQTARIIILGSGILRSKTHLSEVDIESIL
jgi:hypothetical protein